MSKVFTEGEIKEIMQEFYNDLHRSIRELRANGVADNDWFRNWTGICSNLNSWAAAKGLYVYCSVLGNALNQEFIKAGLDPTTPFNSSLHQHYHTEQANRQLYQNPSRIDWIQERMADPVKIESEVSKLTRRFLRQMARWIHAGMPEHPMFVKNRALCATYADWLIEAALNNATYAACFEHLTHLFEKAGLDKKYPFNEGRMIKYREELDNDAFYQNKERLAFIRRNYRKPKP